MGLLGHSPDEYFHRTVTEFLLEWERSIGERPLAGTYGLTTELPEVAEGRRERGIPVQGRAEPVAVHLLLALGPDTDTD